MSEGRADDSRRPPRAGVPWRPTNIGVVVPAKDEGDQLAACLQALRRAARRVTVPVTVLVVLDDCSDDSLEVVDACASAAIGMTIRALSITANSVGAARRIGMSTILGGAQSEDSWLACTDADSVVPPQWFSAQLKHAAAGARVVAGTVEVADWSEHDPAVRDRAIAEYASTGAEHRHVHGANLSFAADAYQAAGGFSDRTFDEDVALVAAFHANAEPIAWSLDLPVRTSARRNARAPRGFASYLSNLGTTDCMSSSASPARRS